MEVKMTGPSHDLHSGLFGGAVANPANVLCEVLGTLHDADGRVMIEGFYDDVLLLTPDERAEWAQLPFEEAAFQQEVGAPELFGEKGFTTLERKWARPTCDINGLTSGYQGPGAKTVLPGVASAKVSMRLVPNQDPAKIAAAFEKAIRERTPDTVKVEVHCHSHTAPVLVPRQSEAIKLAVKALEIGFGAKPTYMREGGSIPVVSLFKHELKIDTLLLGFGLSDDRVHSPNEKFDLDALHGGTRTAAALYDRLAALTAQPVH
jgi:succinyl-diaminopimelate desuccinylase